MRADRLIALLLLLQRRGRITAAEVATELEVSARTARRDLEALAMSGVPVYSRHGRGGGWELIGGASTDLTGLSIEEARALFLAAGPAIAETPELTSALRKLTGALPGPFRDQAEAATGAIRIDPRGWGQIVGGHQPRFLAPLTDAVVRGRQVELDYRSATSPRRRRLVHPLGLVTKRNIWYLVAGTGADGGDGIRTYRVGRVLGVETLDEPVVRPDRFDLDRAWAGIVTEVESRRTPLAVRLRIDQELTGPLRWTFGHQVTLGEPEADGQVPATVEAAGVEAFAAQIAGFGERVELIDAPPEVHRELARLGAELHRRYGSG